MSSTAYYIYNRLKLLGLSESIARFATAQAAHETGGFTSAIFKENKNAFGYKYVGQRLATGENRGHAVYENLDKSVQEFAEYWNRKRIINPFPLFITSPRVFVEYLKKQGYFTDKLDNYLAGVNRYYNQIFG